ncbi:MAG: hypothetical protein Tsb0020_27270 [Haliangiales bacterium]
MSMFDVQHAALATLAGVALVVTATPAAAQPEPAQPIPPVEPTVIPAPAPPPTVPAPSPVPPPVASPAPPTPGQAEPPTSAPPAVTPEPQRQAQPVTPARAGPGGRAAPAAAPARRPGVLAGVYDDASSGRAWFTPTALTAPQGTLTFSNHEILFVGMGAAVTDHLQISGITMLPIAGDFLPFFLSAKYGIPVTSRFHLGAQVSLAGVLDSGDSDDSGAIALAGGIATLCIDADCSSLLTGYATTGSLLGEDESTYPVMYSVSWIQRLSRRFRLMLELNRAAVIDRFVDDEDRVTLFWYGFRVTSPTFGVDFGFVRPFVEDELDDFPFGFPWLNLTYRGI